MTIDARFPFHYESPRPAPSYGATLPIPPRFYRVTDDQSFILPCPGCRFCGQSSCIPFVVPFFGDGSTLASNLTRERLCQHLSWRSINGRQTLISVCDALQDARAEVASRLAYGRTNIKLTSISTEKLRWDVMLLNGAEIDVLVDLHAQHWTVFVGAMSLISHYGLWDQLPGWVLRGAESEWFAIDYIPADKVIKAEEENYYR